MTTGLSIVIPAYNRAELIGRCLESILKVEYRPLQIVVVDDGSTDDCFSRAKSYQQAFEQRSIELLCQQQPHSGAQVARNLGLKLAFYSHVMFLDSDDYVDANGVNRLAKAIDRQDCMTTGLVDRVEFGGGLIETIGREWKYPKINRILDYDWHTIGVIYNIEFVRSIGGWNPVLIGSQDWELQVRAKCNAQKIAHHPIRIGFWVSHDGPRVGATQFKRSYTESVIVASGLNLQTLIDTGKATVLNQARLAGRIAMHLDELERHGFQKAEAWANVRQHFPGKIPWLFSIMLQLPWRLISRIRGMGNG